MGIPAPSPSPATVLDEVSRAVRAAYKWLPAIAILGPRWPRRLDPQPAADVIAARLQCPESPCQCPLLSLEVVASPRELTVEAIKCDGGRETLAQLEQGRGRAFVCRLGCSVPGGQGVPLFQSAAPTWLSFRAGDSRSSVRIGSFERRLVPGGRLSIVPAPGPQALVQLTCTCSRYACLHEHRLSAFVGSSLGGFVWRAVLGTSRHRPRPKELVCGMLLAVLAEGGVVERP